MISCDIVRDLLPLYADGLASEASAAAIRAHVEGCPACRAEMERMCAPLAADAPPENLDYRKALFRERRRGMTNTAACALAALILGAAVCLLVLWSRGVFHIIDRASAPGGAMTATVYNCDLTDGFPKTPGFTLRTAYSDPSQGYYLAVYPDAEFEGMAWSPSGRYLLLDFHTENGLTMELGDYVGNHSTSIQYLFNIAKGAEYSFVQWREDDAMLIRYAYTDALGAEHMGYFWYSCETWSVSGLVELPPEDAVE